MNLSISDLIPSLHGADSLAIHPIGHSTVSGNRVSKVLDVECTFEARGKEAAEWSDEGCECGHDKAVDLEWSIVKGRCGSAKLVVSGVRANVRERRTVDSKRCRTGAAKGSSRHTNTGLGLQVTFEKALAPRSRAGQIM
jgi:hypothetical protein